MSQKCLRKGCDSGLPGVWVPKLLIHPDSGLIDTPAEALLANLHTCETCRAPITAEDVLQGGGKEKLEHAFLAAGADPPGWSFTQIVWVGPGGEVWSKP